MSARRWWFKIAIVPDVGYMFFSPICMVEPPKSIGLLARLPPYRNEIVATVEDNLLLLPDR
jgi:hypothetical protein